MTRSVRALHILVFLFAGSALQANISFEITHEHCGNVGGQVFASVNGGVPPYTYSWDNGAVTNYINNVVAGSYTLTVTDNVGGQQVATAVVQNLPSWEWDPMQGLAQAIPSCDGSPGGMILFGGDIPAYPLGPAPHLDDAGCAEDLQPQNLPEDFQWFQIRTICYWGSPGQTYAVNYSDANGCPGYMEAVVPQPPQFYPVSVLDIEGSCSGGANGRVQFSIPPEADYIYGIRPRLYDDQWVMDQDFENSLATNWTGGWFYDVPDLAAGTYAIVRRMLHDTDFDLYNFGCGDTTYFTVPDLGPTCGHISGTVAMDVDLDCALDFSDTPVPEMVIEFTPGPYYATTNAQGEYGINLPLGNYTVTQQTSVVDEHCLLDPITLDVVGSATFNMLDTATQALDIQLSMASGPARPGFQMQYAIDVDNLTSATSNTNQVVMSFDPALGYISASPTPSNVSGNTITWNNAGSLYYFGHRDISVSLQVPPDVGLIGTDLQATATVTPGAADVNAANNTASVITTVTGSYDPNDKTATTSSQWSRDLYYIDVDQWIDYTVRFQNTGTDTAFTVVITDTLPTTLNAGSITMGAGSHPFTWELQGGGTLKCYFINILLPDSNVNEPASHGFVSFRIRPQQPVVAGTVIENTANIYFDFNDPVITEPSVLTAEFSTGVNEERVNALIVAPNPTTGEVRITAGSEVIAQVTLFTVDGRTMMNSMPNASNATFNMERLPSGVYLVRVQYADGKTERTQLIKH